MEERRDFINAERVDEHILVVTIDRPEARNAFNRAMALRMEEIVDAFDADESLWVAVLRASGTTFCAGQDLKAAARKEFPVGARRGGFGILEKPPAKPLIAAIEGHAYAGGFELALCCDLIVAADDTQFALTEVKRGLVAGGGGCLRLPRRLPYHLALEMALTGEPQPAQRMQAFGLVSRITPKGQTTDEALDMARAILRNSPVSVFATKEIVYRSVHEQWSDAEGWENQKAQIRRVVRSEDSREGVAAFAEKRQPVWQNR